MTSVPATLSEASIFVIDDDASIRRALARLLAGQGWHVETFQSAAEFLERAPFDGNGCVVLDVYMPGMAGPEAHRKMVERGITMPVVFLTAHGDLPTAVGSMKRGAVDFLAKPVDEELLVATLREALARHAVSLEERRLRSGIEMRVAKLTRRQREVLSLVIAGRLNKQIADAMGISIKTVKVHRARVMERLEVASIAGLVHACETIGLRAGPAAR